MEQLNLHLSSVGDSRKYGFYVRRVNIQINENNKLLKNEKRK